MALKKTLKCPKCSRRFGMPAHLARHVNTVHARGRRAKSGPGRPSQTPIRGMPRAHVAMSRLGLLSLEQLRDVIDAARSEARKRLKQLQSAFR